MSTKILALHGYAMNAAWFRDWLTPLEDALGETVEWACPQAPIEVPEAEVQAMLRRFDLGLPPARIGAGQNWCWYRASDDRPPRYSGLDTTLEWLQGLCREQGPFAGVLGWSQGAAMAAIMAAAQQARPDYDFGIKWLVLCGGFLPADPALQPWFARPVPLTSLHVVGRKESAAMQQRARQLQAAFQGGEWLSTPLGHRMPLQLPDCRDYIAAWIRVRLASA